MFLKGVDSAWSKLSQQNSLIGMICGLFTIHSAGAMFTAMAIVLKGSIFKFVKPQ